MSNFLVKFNMVSVVLMLILLPFTIFAQTDRQTCSSIGYTIETINGVFIGLDGAIFNRDSLDAFLPSTYNGEPLIIDYLLNKTHSILDITDTAIQKSFEGNTRQSADFIKIQTDASLQVKTQKLLLVAHSQGNFYANDLYKAVKENGDLAPQSMGVYSVGTPANNVAGNGRYLTSSTDKIIAGLAENLLWGKIMPTNDTINYKLSDDNGLGHSFSDVYLKYRSTKIIDDIKWSLDRLSVDTARSEDVACISAPAALTTLQKVMNPPLYAVDVSATLGIVGVVSTKNAIVGAYKLTESFANLAFNAEVALAKWTYHTAVATVKWTYHTAVAVAVWSYDTATVVAKTAWGIASTIGSFTYNVLTGALSNNQITNNNNASVILATVPIPVQDLPVVNANNIVPTTPATALVNNQTAPNTQQQPQTVFVFEPKVQEGTDMPKLVFVGSFSGGSANAQVMGAQTTAPVSEELAVLETDEEVADNAGLAMAEPALSAPQCAQTLATDGCLLATTTVRFEWSAVSGADHYLLNKNGEYATTTEKSFDVEIKDFSDYIFEVVAIGADGVASATSTQAVSVATIPIAINEIAWMGTVASANDEWFEIKNNTNHTIDLTQWELNAKDGAPHVVLTGTIAPRAYIIFERKDDTVVADIEAHATTTGALNNGGDQLTLMRDSVIFDQTPEGSWSAGYNSTSTRQTMERYSSRESGSDPENWGTNLGAQRTVEQIRGCVFSAKSNKEHHECYRKDFFSNGKDADGNAIAGTPGERNSVSYLINNGKDITSNVILATSDDAYVIPDGAEVHVHASGTLIIEPGVTISFYGGQWDEKQILVEGRLDAQGTAENPIVFKPFFPDYYYQVGGVHFSAGTGTSTMTHVRFENTNGILMTDGAHLSIQDSQFVNNYAGIESDGKNILAINNTSFENTEEEVVWAYSGGFVSIASSTITNTIDGAAIDVYDGVSLTVASTTIDGVYDRSNAGIEIGGSNVSIINSVIRNTRSEGIDAYSSNVSIEGLVVSNTTENGIYLYKSTSTIANTTIESGVGYSGIAVVYGTLSVASSTIRNVLNDGIGLYSASSTISNTVVENGTGTGILIEGGTAAIINTSISGFAGSGIITSPFVEDIFTDDGSGSGSWTIATSTVESITVTGGEITRNGFGVDVSSADSAIITDVHIHDNGTSGEE